MLRAKVIRTVNPKRSGRRAAEKNPTSLVTLGVVNPRSHMKKKAKAAPKARPKKRNGFPFFGKKKTAAAARPKHRPRKFRRNPGIGGLLSKPAELVIGGAFALGGVVVTRQLPQIVLKEKNSGGTGYLANLITAISLAWAVSKTVGPTQGMFAGIGGGAYLVSRVLLEQVSPVGRVLSLAGLGDVMAAGNLGAPALAPLPDNYSPTPNARYRDGRSVNRTLLANDAVAAVAAAAPVVNVSNMSGWGLAA